MYKWIIVASGIVGGSMQVMWLTRNIMTIPNFKITANSQLYQFYIQKDKYFIDLHEIKLKK